MIFYTADTHFGHNKIRHYCNRPHPTVEAMNEALIANWNAAIRPTDTVYFLGDFAAWRDAPDPKIYFDRLQGKKHLIIGNHDKALTLALPWASIQHYLEVTDSRQRIVLFHYGIRSWNGLFRQALQFYGHSHGKLPGTSQSLDVGVDCWDYIPVTLAQIKQRLATLPLCIAEEGAYDPARDAPTPPETDHAG